MNCSFYEKTLNSSEKLQQNNGEIGQINDETCCSCCGTPIFDQFMLKISDKIYHEICLRCCMCGIFLRERCFEKDGQFYCRTHYYKECSPFKCVGCKKGISPTDMVYKFKSDIFYHVNCHRCYQCEKVLSPGEQILVDETSKTVACLVHNTSTKTTIDASSVCQNFAYPNGKEIFSNTFDSTIARELDSPLSLSQFSLDSYGYDYADGKYLKRRGPRTTIKQSQLDILNQIFMSTPKPSKHARAKLALETGLSMRVIQVWFQNRRSKERRLKHLCNYLRHYEQRGLIPPPFSLDQNVSRFFNSSVSSTTSITIKQLLAFPFDETNDGDEEDGDYIM